MCLLGNFGNKKAFSRARQILISIVSVFMNACFVFDMNACFILRMYMYSGHMRWHVSKAVHDSLGSSASQEKFLSRPPARVGLHTRAVCGIVCGLGDARVHVFEKCSMRIKQCKPFPIA